MLLVLILHSSVQSSFSQHLHSIGASSRENCCLKPESPLLYQRNLCTSQAVVFWFTEIPLCCSPRTLSVTPVALLLTREFYWKTFSKMGESWFLVPCKSESFFFTQVCTRGYNSDSRGIWLWEDCDLTVSLKILQQ